MANNNNLRGAVDAERRKRFLENLIKEAIINVLAEQQAPDAAVAQAAPPSDAPAPDAGLAPEPSQAPEQDPNAAKPPAEFTVDDMIERLNTVRGGRSFTDPEVYGQLITWFKKLNDDQKAVLQNFLIEIGQIVVNLPSKKPEETQAPAASAPPPAPAAAPPAPPPAAAPAPEAPPVAAAQTPGA